MSKFVPRWAHWNAAAEAAPSAPMANQRACKTIKSPFAGFAGSLDAHSEGATDLVNRGDTDLAAGSSVSVQTQDQQACTTSRSPFAGFAGSLDGHSEGTADLTDREDTDLASCASESVPTANQRACKTSRSPFAGFAGATESHARPTNDEAVPISEAAAEDDPLASMPLSEFAKAGLVETIYSNLLKCWILVVSDNALDKIPADNELPVYRASEMLRLALLRPEPRTLQTIHDVKIVFDGVICHGE